jgi:arginyl-tRNA synthetase
LAFKLFRYPLAVSQANEKYDPSEIAKYLFELAQSFNDYYHDVPVLKAAAEVRLARLALIKAVSQVIKNGLDLLGIEVVEEM